MSYPYFYQIQKRRPLTHLNREMDRLFDDFWAPQWSPAYDIEEAEDHYLLSLELAGVSKDQIKLEVLDDQLVISGERRLERFQRAFTIPAGVDADKVEANYQDGMLRVYVPKAESAKPRQIRITNGSSTGFFGKLLGSSKKDSEGTRLSSEANPEKIA
jgi:HSP20 family protein